MWLVMGRRNAANNTEISQSCRSTACIAAVLVPTRLGTFRGAPTGVACGRDGYPLAAGLIIAMMVGFGIAGVLL